MKKLLISIFILFLFVSFSNAQDIQFPPSILSAGGGAVKDNESHISKWRTGQVNILQVKSNEIKSDNLTALNKSDASWINGWEITAFPNPVTDILRIQFDIKASSSFGINVTDVSGRKVLERKPQPVLPNEVVRLVLHDLNPAIYIVNIRSEETSIHQIIKVSKQ